MWKIAFDIQQRRAVPRIDVLDVDGASFNAPNPAQGQSDQIGAHRRMSSEYARKGVGWIPAGMHLQDRPFFRRIVFVKPKQHLNVGIGGEPFQPFRILWIDLDPRVLTWMMNDTDNLKLKIAMDHVPSFQMSGW